MLSSSHVHLITWGIGRSLTYLAVYATYVYVRTYVRYIELVASNNYNSVVNPYSYLHSGYKDPSHMLPSTNVHLLTCGKCRSYTYFAVYATYVYVSTYVMNIELVASNNYNN